MPTTTLTTEQAGVQIVRGGSTWGTFGGPASVTWGVRANVPGYETFYKDNNNQNQPYKIQTTFQQSPTPQADAMALSLQLMSDIANITFTRVGGNGVTDAATILVGTYENTADGSAGFAFLPTSDDTSAGGRQGDIWLDRTSVSGTVLPFGSYSFFTVLHEAGHSIGLDHPGDYNAAPGQDITYQNNADYIQDTMQYSMMSYFYAFETGAQHNGYFASTPLLHDIAALQRAYGANMNTRLDDTVYGFNSTAGRDVFDFTKNTSPIVAIWDAGGIDTLDLSGFSSNQHISLAAEIFSDVGGLTKNLVIARGAVIENAKGGSGNDTILGNFGVNFLFGNGGNDVISGGGYDALYGGRGNDTLDSQGYTDLLHGGAGDDTYVIYSAGNSDQIFEGFGDGFDTVIANGPSFRLGDNLERLILDSFSSSGFGNELDNLITGGAGDNEIEGGGGNDVIEGLGGYDRIQGGDGNDEIRGGADYGFLEGGSGDDRLIGGVDGDALIGGIGNDMLFGEGGNDTLTFDDGRDLLSGGTGDDNYYIYFEGVEAIIEEFANEGYDQVIAYVSFKLSANIETLVLVVATAAANGTGNAQANSIFGNENDNFLDGLGGNDRLEGGGGADILSGGADDDMLIAQDGDDLLNGDDGNDTLYGDGLFEVSIGGVTSTPFGNDRLNGGQGSDKLYGYAGADILIGGEDNDSLYGGLGEDQIDGGIGNDVLFGGLGADRLIGGAGIDYARYDDGNYGNLVITLLTPQFNTGAAAGDTYNGIEGIIAGAGNDRVDGNTFVNYLYGAGGNDTIVANLGNDVVSGGAGRDTFVFNTALNASTNLDRILDFNVTDDTIWIDRTFFGGLAVGTLDATNFRTGAAAADADDRIIYNSANGALIFDSNGSAAGGATQFATLSAGLALSAADFQIIA